jgi:hypothetical protein
MKDNQPVIIIECKNWKEKLDRHNSQLHRYFNVTKSRFAILTNGIEYEFYTDIEKPNLMDEKPFLQISIDKLRDSDTNELSKFHKSNFDLDNILSSANSLKYIKAIRGEFEKEIESPSDEFTKLLVGRFYDGRFTSKRLEDFREYAKRAIRTSINDVINTRLKSALSKEEEKQDEVMKNEKVPKIVTTDEELEAYGIVVAILRRKITKDRISHRDTQSYFGILLDNNNRKPICRLKLDGQKKYISLFNTDDRSERKELINSIEDIYNFEKELLETIEFYDTL